jgi:glycosyltransferase involved in cell wall biosynthesis
VTEPSTKGASRSGERLPDPLRKPAQVLLIHHTIDPNMVPVLKRLAETPGIALNVLFASRLPPHRQWPGELDSGLGYRILPSLQVNLGLRGAPLVLRANPTILGEIRRARPDVIISTPFPSLTSLAALAACRLQRCPFILDIYTMRNQSAGRKLLGPLLRGIVRSCTGFVAKSTRTVEYLRSLGAPADRIFLSFHAVDYPSLRERSRLGPAERTALRAKYGIPSGRLILYVGRLVERKGVRVLIEAFKRVKAACPDAALLLVGDGYQRGELERLCRDEAIPDVYFTGSVPYHEVPRFYGLADLFVLPSIPAMVTVWGEEVWGFVVAEAIACGLPVVVTEKVGGSDDLVREGINGHVVAAGDPAQLAAAMVRILADPPLRGRMGDAAQRVAQEFSYDRAAEGYRAAIAAVLGDAAR